MKPICIIPARGGSQRIPWKNIKTFHGKPIIAYSIKVAQASGLFSRVIVSTDHESIATEVKWYGAEVWMRDPAYGHDDVGTQAVVKECLEGMGIKTGIACCIYATAPLMSVEDLKSGYGLLCSNGNLDYVLSVGYTPLPLHDAGQFYWGTVGAFLNKAPLIGEFTGMICIDHCRDCDINTPEDWDRALKMYEALRNE